MQIKINVLDVQVKQYTPLIIMVYKLWCYTSYIGVCDDGYDGLWERYLVVHPYKMILFEKMISKNKILFLKFFW